MRSTGEAFLFVHLDLFFFFIYSRLNLDEKKRVLIVVFIISTLGADGEWEITAEVTMPCLLQFKTLWLYALLGSYDSITEAVFTLWH